MRLKRPDRSLRAMYESVRSAGTKPKRIEVEVAGEHPVIDAGANNS